MTGHALKSGSDHRVRVATLEVLGEHWTLLIVRDAMLGLTRFDAAGDLKVLPGPGLPAGRS